MSQPINCQGDHLIFPIVFKNTNLLGDVEILLHVKFCWIPFSGSRWEVENAPANQRPGRPSWFPDLPEKHKLGRRTLRSCFLSSIVEFRSVVSENSKMSQPINCQGGHLIFPIGLKNTNFLGTLRSCFMSSFVEFPSAVPEKLKMPQPIRGLGGHLVIPIDPKTQTW